MIVGPYVATGLPLGLTLQVNAQHEALWMFLAHSPYKELGDATLNFGLKLDHGEHPAL